MEIRALKQALKKNKILDATSRILAYPMFKSQYAKSDNEAKKRKEGRIDPDYIWIQGLKDKYLGERCFVVATGPSLTLEDLYLIRNEYSFGMNSCLLIFNKSPWRPNFFAIQDEYVFADLKDQLDAVSSDDLKEIWVSDSLASHYSMSSRYHVFPLHYLDHKMYHRNGYGEFRFSDDCYSCIYDAYSVTFSILQFACYMGFRKIYLLGCDCNYNQAKTHFVEYGHRDPKAKIMGSKMIAGHVEFKKFADEKNIHVVNCTRGGMLEVYPRENLETVLSRR